MSNLSAVLSQPFFGIFLSLALFLLGSYLFKKSHGFFLLQPLFFSMVLGIIVLIIIAALMKMDTKTVYTNFYKPGGDIIFWFLSPATIAFAVPLYKRNDIVKKYWLQILLSLLIGTLISTILIYLVAVAMGLDHSSVFALLPQAATTAIAMPIATAIGGNASITAMAAILNGVIVYALGDYLIKIFRLQSSPIGVGLGLGASGHTIGSAKAVELGSIEGSMGSVAVIVIGLIVDIVVPIFARIVG